MTLESHFSVARAVLEALVRGLWTNVPLLLVALPAFIVASLLHRKKRRYRAEAESPFTGLSARPAGESLRKRIDELSERFDLTIQLLLLVPLFALVTALLSGLWTKPQGAWFFGVVMIGSTIYLGRRSFQLARELWDARLGLSGEIVVAEVLNELRADGFKIFHDVPFEGFNIDHVLVGPSGVYAIETKTRRKPAALRGSAKATAVFDGRSLRFPWGVDTFGLEQAARNAKTLAQWLTSCTGERTEVGAILTLPGWWVERRDRGAVNVLNPKEIRAAVIGTRVVVAPGQIQRIAHQLAQRCRMDVE